MVQNLTLIHRDSSSKLDENLIGWKQNWMSRKKNGDHLQDSVLYSKAISS